MPAPRPVIVHWTEHALRKAERLGLTRADVERAVLGGHAQRQRNAGAAGWRVRVARITVVYDHPARGDDQAALIISLWRWG